MKRKSVKWLILWAILLQIGTLASVFYTVFYHVRNGVALSYPPFTDFQLIMLLGFLPFCAMPALAASFYYAVKEKFKPIKIASAILLGHHIFCVFAVLFQL